MQSCSKINIHYNTDLQALFYVTIFQMLTPNSGEITKQNFIMVFTKHRLHDPFSASNC